MIVQTAVHGMFLDIREALGIWLLLVAVVATACLAMSTRARRARPRRMGSRRNRAGSNGPAATASQRAHRRDWTMMDGGAPRDGSGDREAELRRYAEEVGVAAARAAESAQRWHAEWIAVRNAKDAAWQAYEKAAGAARRTFEAAAFPTPFARLTPDELTARERYLHRAAREAYRRGELSLSALIDALSHRNGWDPRRHPFEQEVILRRIGLERKAEAYRTVAAMERHARETAEVAEAARCSLRNEAFAATVRAWEVDRAATARAARRYVPVRPYHRPDLAMTSS